MLRWSPKRVEKHVHLIGQQHMLSRQEEEGLPPPIWDLKTSFSPLKFHWNSAVKRPKQDSFKSFKGRQAA